MLDQGKRLNRTGWSLTYVEDRCELRMRVRVLYFGVLKDVLGREREELELPEGSLADAVLRVVEQRGQAASGVWRSAAIAVNREYVRASAVLHEGDEVALLPPVSGGNHAH